MSKSFLFLLFFIHTTLNAAEVTSFSPEGNVKNIQQVTARFSTDMKSLGDPRDTIIPFTASCEDNRGKELKVPASTSRWADTKNWVLDFTNPLSAGIQCKMSMKQGLKDLAGIVVPYREFQFSTSGPAIVESLTSYDSI